MTPRTDSGDGGAEPVDLLAVMPHRDDAELLCGGTLIRASDRGHRAGVLDLTRGEAGSRGSAEERALEAERAAQVMGLAARANAGLPDAGIRNDDESRRRVVSLLRAFRPRVVILPWKRGRHPDHRVGSELTRDACYLAGIERYGEG
ncbi:MAG: PIG-L family deacetylase, partial [Gemmatimonadota bacterium]